MNYVAILSQEKSESHPFLAEALKSVGIEVDIFHLDERIELDIEKGVLIDTSTNTQYLVRKYSLIYGRTWGDLDASQKMEKWVCAISEKFKIPSLDSVDGIHLCHNKNKMISVFTDNDISMPATLTVKDISIDEAIKLCLEKFSNMVVIKRNGSGGKNIEFIPLHDNGVRLKAKLSASFPNDNIGEYLILQQYVESKNDEFLTYHYRVIVVDGILVMGMKFTAKTSDILCSNIALGGTAEIVSLDDIFTPSQKEQIKKSCIVIGANVGGVDVIFSPTTKEMYILEVNIAPGLATAVTQCGIYDHLYSIAAYCRKIVDQSLNHTIQQCT